MAVLLTQIDPLCGNWKQALTHTHDPNWFAAIKIVHVNGRSLYIVDWRVVVMEGGISYTLWKGRGNCPGGNIYGGKCPDHMAAFHRLYGSPADWQPETGYINVRIEYPTACVVNATLSRLNFRLSTRTTRLFDANFIYRNLYCDIYQWLCCNNYIYNFIVEVAVCQPFI